MFYTIPDVKNPEKVHFEPRNSKLQCTGGPAVVGKFFAVHWASHLVYQGPALILATTFLPHPGNINAPVPEGFYKHRCWCILQVLGPSNIVVFYYLLLCHRQYMACGVCSSVNNSTLGRCACSLLGWSHMEHCQHQLLGHIQYSWTIICASQLCHLGKQWVVGMKWDFPCIKKCCVFGGAMNSV